MTPFRFQPEMLSALLDEQLPPDQKSAVEEHLANHPGDAQLYADMRQLRQLVQSLPQQTAPAGLHSSVMSQILARPVVEKVLRPAPASRINATHWLFAAAASLGTLAIVTIYHSVQSAPQRLASRTDVPASAATRPVPDDVAREELPKVRVTASKEAETGALQVDQRKESLDVAQAAPSGVADRQQLRVPVDPPAEYRLAQGRDAPSASSGQAPEIGGRGGGGFGGGNRARRAGIKADSIEADEIQSAFAETETTRANESLAQPEAALSFENRPLGETAEHGTRLDHLIFVRVPNGQSAEEWIQGVFKNAQVQLEISQGMESFGEVMEKREEDKKLLADAENNPLRADVDAAESLQPEMVSAPEYMRPDALTTAYWVDAEVRQIGSIMDQLEGAVIVGFVAPGLETLSSKSRTEPPSYSAKPALARRLGRLADIPSADADRGLGGGDAPKDAAALQKPGLEALGLEGKPPTERYRILFVFHTTPPAAPAAPQK